MKFLSKKTKIDNSTFVELVNKQLEPHNLTYTDVRNDANWFMKYSTTIEQQSFFMDWAVGFLIENLNMKPVDAENEISWFVLQYGLIVLNKENVI